MKRLVFKCGGSAMNHLTPELYRLFVERQQSGDELVLVHGGGPAITELLGRLEIPTQFVNGLRVTCEKSVQVVEMVLSGKINPAIVRGLLSAGGRAAGVSGMDGDLLLAEMSRSGLGYVGEVKEVRADLLKMLLANGYIPVVSPIARAIEGEFALNINGDTAAGAIAGALEADGLIMMTDVEGIREKNGAIVPEWTLVEAEQAIDHGTVSGGMIPKVRAALHALEQGVRKTVILHGTAEYLYRYFAGEQVGTVIRR